MALNLIRWLSLCLLVTAAFANQISDPDNTCFASNNASPKTNYDACCPGPAKNSKFQSGTGYAGGVQFRYQCGVSPDPAGNEVPHKVGSMQDCAALCAETTDCKAGTWDYQFSRCFLTNKMTGQTKLSRLWVLLEKVSSGSPEVENALKECLRVRDDCQNTVLHLEESVDTLTNQLIACRAGDGGKEGGLAKRSGCPTADGKKVTVGSSTYTITCSRSYVSGQDKKRLVPKVASFEDCVSLCSDETSCQGITYDERPGQQWCWVHYEIGVEEITSNVVARRLD
ncbi:hypothetical protein ETB97_005303 [Aspergillus alliaceus]|uniref:Apple domain-containing protein n=1 Tax=Petromyces alliaceus TaxID=209559 RepID=A0A8H6ADB4_PETAA|nr:hypothetical protein ETB97_005303 [Aspergillus burnettii]